MDEVGDLDQKISMLEEELSKMKTFHSHGQSTIKVSHSTPKVQVRNLSDSGIVQSRDANYSEQTQQGSIGTSQSRRTTGTPTLDGAYTNRKAEDTGARPKVPQKSNHSDRETQNDSMQMPALSPILRDRTRQPMRSPQKNSKDISNQAKPRREMKVANYDGTSEWSDFKSHFDACAMINKWDDQDKGLYLATALRGQAQGVFGDLPADKKMEYDTLGKALEERFSPPNQTELYRIQLKEKRQKASDSLPELGQSIRRLVNRAYPNTPSEVRETLAREHFLDSLVDSERRIRIKQSRPGNLNQAICLAVELEAFYKAERKYDTGRGHLRATCAAEEKTEDSSEKMVTLMEAFSAKIDALQMDLDNFKNEMSEKSSGIRRPGWKSKISCFNCGKLGHFKSECRAPKNHYAKTNDSRDGAVRPLYFNSRQNRIERRKLNLGANDSNMEAGAYLDVVVNDHTTKFLVDTGATVTLLSHELFYRIPRKDRPELEPIKQMIISANGTELKIAGKGKFSLKLGKEKFEIEALVADLSIAGILGLDFMKEYDCHIDFQKDTLRCRNSAYPLQFSGKIGCYRISAAEDISIPPGTEALANGKINDFDALRDNIEIGIIEPCEKFVERDSALLAKTLVKACEHVPIRLLNVTSEVKVIKAGTVIGKKKPS